MPRIHYSDEVKQQAVSLVVDDLLSVAEAARQTGCSAFTLTSWIKKHRQSLDPSSEPPAKPPAFISVKLVDSPSAPVEIVAPNGYILRLSDASTQYIIELLIALASC